MKRVLVTGGAGFIGSHLVEALLKTDVEIYVVDNFSTGKREHVKALPAENIFLGDIRDRHRLRETIDAVRPDVVFHLAAIHFIPYCNDHPTETIFTNIRGTQLLLDLLRGHKTLQKLFFASTAAVYPIAKSAHAETDEEGPIDIYGITKSVGESLVGAFAESSNVPTVIGRLFNAIGHRETNPHLLPEIVEQLRNGSRSLRLGNLDPRRDFIDARDMAQGIIAATESTHFGCATFNIGSGWQYSVRDVVTLCEKILGENIAIVQDAARVRKVERNNLAANVDKLIKTTGWTPKIDLTTTLKELLLGPA